jgi:hypothetical protein
LVGFVLLKSLFYMRLEIAVRQTKTNSFVLNKS